MRIAYIILAHRLPGQLGRLIKALNSPEDAFFVHIDKSADRRSGNDFLQRLLPSIPADATVAFLRRHACYWGSYGIVQATLEGIRAVCDSGLDFDRVVLLSGQDYPLRSVRQLKQYFEQHHSTEFIESFPLALPNRWTHQEGPFNDRARVGHWHVHLRSRSIQIPLPRKFLRGMKPFGGSQWWALSMGCVRYLQAIVNRKGPELRSFFRYAFIPDEVFFQTLVSNSAYGEHISGFDLTFADWDRPAPPYPAVLRTADLPVLQASQKLFARKFDSEVDSDILDLLDEQVLDVTGARQSVSPSRQSAWASPPAPVRRAG